MDPFSVSAPQESQFVLRSGRRLKNLHELKNALAGMHKDDFSFHVNKTKNDFSNWVLGVFKDKELADKVKQAQTKEDLRKVLESTSNPIKKTIQEIMPKAEIKERPAVRTEVKKETSTIPPELKKRLDEILSKERELGLREKNILEIEEKIERTLSGELKKGVFSRDFMQGCVIGFLACLVLILIYINFF